MQRIRIDNVTKYYGGNLVLDAVDLDVGEHEVVCLIGASGSGKSTLLRCVNKLVPFDHGTIYLDDISIDDDRFKFGNELHKRVGNVLDNITLAPRKVHGVSRAFAEKQALGLLSMFGLDGYAGSFPERLSGGQQQRVAIVRALATQLDVLMLDEVTAALDPELIGGVLRLSGNSKTRA